MRKWIAMILALAMMVSMCACGSSTAAQQSVTDDMSSMTADSVMTTDSVEVELQNTASTEAEIPESDSDVISSEEEEEELDTTEMVAPSGTITVIKADGEVETLTGEEMVQLYADNKVKFQNQYVDAQVILTSTLTSIEMNETVTLMKVDESFNSEAASYTPPIVLHLEGGWLVSVSSADAAENLSVGDTVQVLGTIMGYSEDLDNIAIFNRSRHPVAITECNELKDSAEASGEVLQSLIMEMITGTYYYYYEDATIFVQYYSDTYQQDASTQELLEIIDERSYPGTFLRTYDSMFSSVTEVTEVSAELDGTGYVYYDSAFSANFDAYVQKLENIGFERKSNSLMTVEVEGVEELYIPYTYDNVLFAISTGTDCVKVVVFTV
jgi:hypothetical protein